MAYRHSGFAPLVLSEDPIDPDSTDWVLFSYAGWLRDGEEIIEHAAMVTNGQLIQDSTFCGAVADAKGVRHEEVYGVQIQPNAGAKQLFVTHRVSTTVAGAINLARTNVDRTVILPVRQI